MLRRAEGRSNMYVLELHSVGLASREVLTHSIGQKKYSVESSAEHYGKKGRFY